MLTRLAQTIFSMLAVVCCALLVTAGDIDDQDSGEKETLVVCANPAAMPRTGRGKDGTAKGVDLAVMKLICRELDKDLEVHWCAGACYWNCLRDGRCDAVVGLPHGSGPADEVAWSPPYSGSRFGLVVPKEAKGVRSLDDLRGKRVGIVSGTVPISGNDHMVVRFPARDGLLNQLVPRGLDAALVDADFAAWYLHTRPELPLRAVAEFVPRARWNTGVAVRKGRGALLGQINRALSKLLASGEVASTFSTLGLNYRAPFPTNKPVEVAENTWRRIQERGELIVTMDPDNLPYSSAKDGLPGFDVELAQALAQELGVQLRLEWMDVLRETSVGQLLESECDLAMGAAVEPRAVDDEQVLAGKVIYSKPYYGTGYFLFIRKGGPHVASLAELEGAKSKRLGAQAGSVADYRLRQRGLRRRLFPTQLAVLKSLNDGAIDYGYLWANANWLLHATSDLELQRMPEYVPEDHWNIAIAMRCGDDALKRHVDEALTRLIARGDVSRALARYYVPDLPPFETSRLENKQDAKRTADRAPAQAEPPRMYRRQRSKRPYPALERIRAKGTLVVGLDQNNLPFSTAHPEPAGLDYEIAGRLAEKLELELDVYWAYSSHDSYPSKLATKKLCDVILGVMPDDRFGRRVIYSEPYYHAGYQIVLPAGKGGSTSREQLATLSLAAEVGIAARGLRGREVRHYPNVEAILTAVAQGKEKAGYVISTRGPWLASKQWPGEFKFIDPPTSVDRYPICAAVRRGDGDLKAAIDRAIGEMVASGELVKIFARWNIPYTPPVKQAESSE